MKKARRIFFPSRVSLSVLCALLFIAATIPAALGQTRPGAFDSRAVERATTISGGVCSNPVIGFSYELPPNMKSQDAAAMRDAARIGNEAQWIGPEARYILYGYQETKTLAMLCGASSESGQVQVIATPLSALESEGLHPDEPSLAAIAYKMGQQLGTEPSAARKETINGRDFERADGTASFGPGDKNMDLHGSFYVSQVNSYVVIWNLIGYSEKQWEDLIPTMKSVKISAPRKLTALANSKPPASHSMPISPDFDARLADFLHTWLAARDQAKTLGFFDSAAFTAPSLIGTYCDGWYRKDASASEARDTIASNLMGVAADFPKESPPAAIFNGSDRLPPEWLDAAGNDVPQDHFLVIALTPDTLGHLFTGTLKHSNYEVFLENQTKGADSYWVIFPERRPDGHIFVLFTLWQKKQGPWAITHIDVVCP